jgi:hypothetical protein
MPPNDQAADSTPVDSPRPKESEAVFQTVPDQKPPMTTKQWLLVLSAFVVFLNTW